MSGTMPRVWTAFAVLSGPVVWMAHFVIVWAVAEFGCGPNYANLAVVPPSAIRTVVIIATLAALVAVAAGGVIGYRRLSSLRAGGITEMESRVQFVVQVGMALSVIFFVSIVVTALPVFVLSACDTAV